MPSRSPVKVRRPVLSAQPTQRTLGTFFNSGGENMKFKISTLVFSLCALAALTTSVPSFGQKLIEFDAPGAGTVSLPLCAPDCGTLAQANNDLGVIVGY